MIKLTKAEWEKFKSSDDKSIWPDDAYMDDVYLTSMDGVELDDDSKDFSSMHDGEFMQLESGCVLDHPKFESIVSLFKAWRKIQTHEIVSVEVPKGFDLKSILKDTGCKIVK